MRSALEPPQTCKLAVALETVGERWSLLIVRGAANGMRHFEQYRESLGIARNILSNRLLRLVKAGIMMRVQMNCDRRRIEYRLTKKGEALLPIISGFQEWSEEWECELGV